LDCLPSICEQADAGELGLTVADADGAAVAGTFVSFAAGSASRRTLIFKPEAPLVPDTTYKVISTSSFVERIVTTVAPVGALDVSGGLALRAMLQSVPDGEALACPQTDSCGGPSPFRTQRRDEVWITSALEELPGWNDARYLVQWVVDGERRETYASTRSALGPLRLDQAKPQYCAAMHLEDVVTGEVHVLDEVCVEHGDLGDLQVRDTTDDELKAYHRGSCAAPLPGREEVFCELLQETCKGSGDTSSGLPCEKLREEPCAAFCGVEGPTEPEVDEDDSNPGADRPASACAADRSEAKGGCSATGGSAALWPALALFTLARRRRPQA
jgi:MYXO-CTERM domain-containing protein